MSEDIRIIKTKKNLKQSLVNMLSKKSFEQISVKELCDFSQTSRVTFYTHYSDKYDLVDDISRDMAEIARKEYYTLQKKNNLKNDPIISFCNLLDSILNMYYGNFGFFSHTSLNESPYLNFSFHKCILKYVETHAQKKSAVLKPKYDIKRITGFLCYGLWGFINEGDIKSFSMEKVRTQAREILSKILICEILTQNT